MTLGGGLGLAGATFPALELAIAASLVLLGLAVVLAPPVGLVGVVVLVTAAGVVHGNARGAEAPTATNPLLFVAGFLAVAAALHLGGVGIGALTRRTPSVRAALGALVAVVGALFLV